LGMSGSFPIKAKMSHKWSTKWDTGQLGVLLGCSENYVETFFAMSLVMQQATTISVRASCSHTSEGAACH